VRQAGKTRKIKRPESLAIAICVKSVLQTRGRTLRKFRCNPEGKKKPFLQTQPLFVGGGSKRSKRFTRHVPKLSQIIEVPETSNAENAKNFVSKVAVLMKNRRRQKAELEAQLAAQKELAKYGLWPTHHSTMG
jgi:hypothetical protein